MEIQLLIKKIGNSLKEENSGAKREEWAHYIIKNNISLIRLAELLTSERVIAMRFMWLVGHTCDIDPKFVQPFVTYFFSMRDKVKILNYNRSLAKLFCVSGVPPEIEGEAIHEMFKWLLDPKANVTTKKYCMASLYELSKKHPDL